MGRKKLEMTPEERRLYNNKKHREQTARRKEKWTRNVYLLLVRAVMEVCEEVGWDKTELLLGRDSEIENAIVDGLIARDEFKIVLGRKPGIKLKEVE